MNENIMRAAGLNKEMDAVGEGKCPICMELIKLHEFKDDISRKEYHISGMCQKCQDKVFG